MKPYYQDKWGKLYYGDCREILPSLSGGSAVVTDPPYELGFMGKSWDSKGVSFQPETWEIIRKACLSGSPLLSFGGSRTQHRIACAIEDAGWEIRDTLMWVYGSGFPKSLDISKAIDKQFGAEREVVGYSSNVYPDSDNWGKESNLSNGFHKQYVAGEPKEKKHGQTPIEKPATPEAQLWEGYGTALKPAYEPIILAMNPLDGTFANNALKHGVAGLNIDECRIDAPSWSRPTTQDIRGGGYGTSQGKNNIAPRSNTKGRFPANFLHDGSQMVMELFPNSKDGMAVNRNRQPELFNKVYGKGRKNDGQDAGYGGNGPAARFFYCAKASKAERDKGCEGLEERQMDESRKEGNPGGDNPRNRGVHKVLNNHPTVKPLSLMEYLCKLVKMPEYNLILDPFCGSGTTLLACIKLGIGYIGIDSDESSCEIAARRCQEALELV